MDQIRDAVFQGLNCKLRPWGRRLVRARRGYIIEGGGLSASETFQTLADAAKEVADEVRWRGEAHGERARRTDKAVRATETPQWTHDCDRCAFLGRYEGTDLYYCPSPSGHGTVIARLGNEGDDYHSGLEVALMAGNPYLWEALKRAVERSLLTLNAIAVIR